MNAGEGGECQKQHMLLSFILSTEAVPSYPIHMRIINSKRTKQRTYFKIQSAVLVSCPGISFI